MGAFRELAAAVRWGLERGQARASGIPIITGEAPTIEQAGEDIHRPIRRPDRWKTVTILGGAVHVDRRWVGRHLLECPDCAALVTDEKAKGRHEGVCPARAVRAEGDARVAELEEARAAAGGFTEEEGEWVS